MIPPALPEVGQPVSKADFKKFKDDAIDPAHFDITYNHHFEPPAEQVSKEMYINSCFDYVKEHTLRVLWSVDSAVFCIALFWKRLPEDRIEELEEFSRFRERLEEYICHKHGIDRSDPE